MSATKTLGLRWYVRRIWWAFKALLFAKGAGWLRWRIESRTDCGSVGGYEPPEEYPVAPPLRRAWETVRDWRYGYFKKPTAWSYLKDPDRAGDITWQWWR